MPAALCKGVLFSFTAPYSSNISKTAVLDTLAAMFKQTLEVVVNAFPQSSSGSGGGGGGSICAPCSRKHLTSSSSLRMVTLCGDSQ